MCFRPAPARYDPTALLDQGVVTSTFSRHLARNPPSKNPGVDVARPHALGRTEGASFEERALTLSPVTGRVVGIKPEPWGRISIQDSSGYVHNLLHNVFSEQSTLKVGDVVLRGEAVARMAHVAPATANIRTDHIHHSIEKDGRLIDAQKAWYDPLTGAVVAEDDDKLSELLKAPPAQNQSRSFDILLKALDDLIDRLNEAADKMSRGQDRIDQKSNAQKANLP